MCQSKAEGGKRCYKAPSYRSIFSQKQLEDMIDQHMVHSSENSALNLTVLKYTKPAVYTQTWNAVTQNCRGLVVDTETNEVLARPFTKFYNYNEPSCPQVDWDEEGITVMDKADGSAGIYVEKHHMLVTPGSSESPQALLGTEMLRERDDFTPVKGRTYMFEIIHPDNRIVLDYGDKKDLVLLGATDTKTGKVIDVDDIPEWKGTKIEKFEANTLREAISKPPRPNAEGFVVRFKDGTMVKVKQADYVDLHRKLSNLSPRYVWETMYAAALMETGDTPEQMVKKGVREGVAQSLAEHGDAMTSLKHDMPEEWYDWIENKYADIAQVQKSEYDRVVSLRDSLPEFGSQKERALYIKANYSKADAGFLLPPELQKNRTLLATMKNARPIGETGSALEDDEG